MELDKALCECMHGYVCLSRCVGVHGLCYRKVSNQTNGLSGELCGFMKM